jgi:hypothetical protein
MVGPKSSIATRKEIKVLKKPLASWTPLVARISVPICARIGALCDINVSNKKNTRLGKGCAKPMPWFEAAVQRSGPKPHDA